MMEGEDGGDGEQGGRGSGERAATPAGEGRVADEEVAPAGGDGLGLLFETRGDAGVHALGGRSVAQGYENLVDCVVVLVWHHSSLGGFRVGASGSSFIKQRARINTEILAAPE
jgi:hypothetical protein